MTFAELLLLLCLGYLLYKVLGPLQKHLEYVFLKMLRRGRRGEKPVIDISTRKER